MYPDIESIVTLNALRRAEIYQEVVGPYRVRQPWAERPGVPPTGPLRRSLRALGAAVVRLHAPVPMKLPWHLTSPSPHQGEH